MKKGIKNFIGSFSVREKKGFIWVVACLILFGMISVITTVKEATLFDQQAADRWSEDGDYAQISCFYPVSMQQDEYYFLNLSHTLEEAMKQDSIVAENENAKLMVYAVSAGGNIDLSSETANVNVNAVGVTEDFFQFHPVDLIGGAYFNDTMLMEDGVLIDEDAAWQLFGSNDVVGMNITIDSIPYYIRGVIDRKEGHFAKAAGLSKSVCYVSLDTLVKHGNVTGSYTYEALLPNPVEGFAMGKVVSALHDDENTIQVVENSKRYHFMPLLQDIRQFGIRSMNQKGIVFPYWENMARAYEDVFAVCLLIKIILLLVIIVLTAIFLFIKWKHKTWTVKSVWKNLRNKMGTAFERVVKKTTAKGGKRKRRKKDEKEENDEKNHQSASDSGNGGRTLRLWKKNRQQQK